MTTAIRRRRGTTTQHSTFTGLDGELTIDTTKETVVVHDGATAGGFPLLREDLSNNTNVTTNAGSQTLTNKTINLGSNTVTGTLAQFNNAVSDADLVSIAGTETLTNKTLTSPTINGNVATTGLNFDSNTLVIDATNNRVGVGTASPSSTLTVSEAGAPIVSVIGNNTQEGQLLFNNTTAARLHTINSVPMIIGTGNTERMRIDTNGNVGVGTSSPATRFHVAGSGLFRNSTAGTQAALSSSSTSLSVVDGTPYNAAPSASITLGASNYDSVNNNSVFQWVMAPTGSAGGHSLTFSGRSFDGTSTYTNTQRLELTASGNLGLGVTPSAWASGWPALQIGTGAAVWGTSDSRVSIGSNVFVGSGPTARYINSTAASQYLQVAGAHQWFTAPSGTAGNAITFTQAMTLDASGNLGIGTTSPNASGVSTAVTLNGSTSAAYEFRIGGNYQAGIASTAGALTNTFPFGGVWRVAQNSGSEAMRITSAGRLLLGQTSDKGGETVRISSSGQANLLLDNTGKTNGAYVGVFNDAALFGVNRNPSTGVFYNTSNYAAEIIALGSSSTSYLAFGTSNAANTAATERMRIDASGNVGIGTGSPSYRLHVSQAGAPQIGITGNNTQEGQLLFTDITAGRISTTNATPLILATNSSERVRIDSAGNVGIGTSSPARRLDVQVSSDGIAASFGKSGGTMQPRLVVKASESASTVTIGTDYAGSTSPALVFETAVAERMRIDSSGRWMLGTTSPSSRATIAFSSSTGGLTITTADDNALYCQYLRSGVTFVDHKISGSTYQIVNFSAGVSLAASGTSWGSLSDERQKDIIEPITNATEKVASLRAVIGKYKTDNPEKRRAFLIAQDVQAVLPEAVYQNSDEDDTLNLAYTDTIPLLVAAIKEQQAIINDLKARIETLESK